MILHGDSQENFCRSISFIMIIRIHYFNMLGNEILALQLIQIEQQLSSHQRPVDICHHEPAILQ